MKFSNKLLKFLLLFLFIITLGSCKYFSKKKAVQEDKTTTSAAYDLRNNMRKLWEDNITWTREVILCYANNLPGAQQAHDRLMKNQDDIAKAIAEYYPDAAQKLTELLHQNVDLTTEFVKISKSKKKRGLDDVEKKLDDNSGAIADYLSQTNPNWKAENIKPLFQNILKYNKNQSEARLKKNYEDDITAFDKANETAVNTADTLSLGLIRQFPDKF
jgi:hypothetical protein